MLRLELLQCMGGENAKMEKSTEELENELKTIHNSETLEMWIDENEIGKGRFCDYLSKLCKEKNIGISSLEKKVALSRAYIYALLNGTKNPTKEAVIKIALGIEADVDTLNLLLKLSGNKELYPKREEDAVIAFGIQNQWSVYQIDELLKKRNLKIRLIDEE